MKNKEITINEEYRWIDKKDNNDVYTDENGMTWFTDYDGKNVGIGRYKMQANEHDIKFKEEISNLNPPPKISPTRDEKQDLIKYLGDKIEGWLKKYINTTDSCEQSYCEGKIIAYQEILDKTKEG